MQPSLQPIGTITTYQAYKLAVKCENIRQTLSLYYEIPLAVSIPKDNIEDVEITLTSYKDYKTISHFEVTKILKYMKMEVQNVIIRCKNINLKGITSNE